MSTIFDRPVQTLEMDPGVNVLSVDLECWDQLVYRRLTGKLIRCSSAMVKATNFLLDLLRQKGVKATFFVVGYVAETFPELVKRIHLEGHEIGTHGYTHSTLDTASPAQFQEEIHRSMALLRSLTGTPILGFRAPEFSLIRKTHWALEILAQEGIRYDSSVVSAAGRKYGVPDFPRGVARVTTDSHSILEAPPSTIRFLRKNRLAAGGSYFRLLPYFLIRRIVRRVNDDGLPFVLYCHPYEFSSERLVVHGDARTRSKLAAAEMELRYNLCRGTMRRKLAKLLDEFRFAPFREVLADALKE
jgi:polysaccharide deacetylase family protein (PEP-CTERM system associated)